MNLAKEEYFKYWFYSAEDLIVRSVDSFNEKRYDWCLFLGHRALMKILKAHYIIKNDTPPPDVNDLLQLSYLSNIKLNEEQILFFDIANQFYSYVRFPTDKLKFYKIVPKEFAVINLKKIIEHYKWLQSLLKY